MIGEIAAIVAGVNAATSAIKQVAEAGNDLSSIGSFITRLGGAEVELARKVNEGSLNPAEAVQAALAKKQIQETMQEVKDLFTVSGNGHLYAECMTQMAQARKEKQAELARAAAAKKKFWKDMRQFGSILLLCLVLLPAVIGGLLAYLVNYR
jgi:phosphoribosylformylglycinamidine (FGAM) synthase-like enzyme